MIVKPTSFKNLVAVENGKIKKISNMILRKPLDKKNQDKKITKNSICVVCTYCFKERKLKWSKNIKAICHPFRDTSIFPKELKTFLFSESDFCDKLISPVKYRMAGWKEKQYDFVYFTINNTHGIRNKGLYLLPLIDKVAGDLGLKGLVVNYRTKEVKNKYGGIFHEAYKKMQKEWKKIKNIKIINKKYSTKEVCAIMLSSKFILYPNTADASPRLLTEAFIRGRPVVVNSSIYGGWKYVNDENGKFFEAPSIKEFVEGKQNDYEISLRNAMVEVSDIDSSKVASNFYKEYGFSNASKKLAKIFNKINGTNYERVVYEEWKKFLKV